MSHPNILFVFADQLRYGTLGCEGNAVIRTPNLDRLAGEGAVFEQAFSSCPVCSPYRGQIVTGNYFSVLGVQPSLGRAFVPEEDRTPDTHPVAVLSHRIWEQQFGGDPGIVGQSVLLNDYPFTVVGVAPNSTGTPSGVRWLSASRTRSLLVIAEHSSRIASGSGDGALFELESRVRRLLPIRARCARS